MISNMGFNEGYITLYVAEGTQKDSVVTVVDGNTCGNCSEGGKFCGILKGIRNNIGSVQVKGYAEIKYSGTAPALGVTSLVADGNGGVKASSSGVSVIVTEVNEETQTVKVIM